ncbi:MAG: hypothetical protein ACRDRL_30215, partial [Sciscionella sp.]
VNGVTAAFCGFAHDGLLLLSTTRPGVDEDELAALATLAPNPTATSGTTAPMTTAPRNLDRTSMFQPPDDVVLAGRNQTPTRPH